MTVHNKTHSLVVENEIRSFKPVTVVMKAAGAPDNSRPGLDAKCGNLNGWPLTTGTVERRAAVTVPPILPVVLLK